MPDTMWLVLAMSTVGAVGAGLTALRRPSLSLIILFVLASFSRATLETPLGTMRPEMPAVAVVAGVLLLGGRFSALRSVPRRVVVITLAFAAYLAVLAYSSAFISPGPPQSLRMVAWVTLSMLSGVVAFTLVRPDPTDAAGPFALTGTLSGALGILAAVAFLAAGPGFDVGIQEAHTVLPRVFALGWEANLYAIFLVMTSFYALELTRGPRSASGFAMLAIILVGMALGITRGAYVGLAVGAVTYAAVRIHADRGTADLPRLGMAAAGFLALGIVASNVLLPNILERPGGVAHMPPGSGPTPAPAGSLGPSPSGARAGSAPPGAASGSPSAIPLPSLEPYPDTLGFRLERVPVAIDDFATSPVVGLGAVSFGQRHPDRYAGSGPDHLAIMAVAVPYEAGILGASAMALGFVVLFGSLVDVARRSSAVGDWRASGLAAASVGSLISVLVAYQLNNAIHLAVNWIVIGAAMALVTGRSPRLLIGVAKGHSFDMNDPPP